MWIYGSNYFTKPMTKLSYSTISEIYNCPMSWLNKLMGMEKYEPSFFKEGRDGHKLIQAHVSGKALIPNFPDIPTFAEVEETDFDPNMQFSAPISWVNSDEYVGFGYMDGKDVKNGRLLEIKLSSNPWSPKKFEDSMQWRFYSLFNPWIKEVYLVTAPRDPKLWDRGTVKVMKREVNEKDKDKAKTWINVAIQIIESGNFKPLADECKSCFYKNCVCVGCKNMRIYG